MSLLDILATKENVVHAIAPTTSVFGAVGKMCSVRVGALLVFERQMPVGILSERDIMTRVVLADRDLKKTLVSSVMTKDVFCVTARTEPEEAMGLMAEHRCRHLPVMAEGRVIGVVSMGDLMRWVEKNLDFELRAIREYVSGTYPSGDPSSDRDVATG